MWQALTKDPGKSALPLQACCTHGFSSVSEVLRGCHGSLSCRAAGMRAVAEVV
jgi:hypothetical protein